jgi:aromatic ring-cleaving dioxygenase
MPYDCGMEMHQNSFGVYYSSPTIAQVVMWLYEKHGIWIQIHHWTKQPVNDDEILENAFQWFANGEADGKIFRTPTEAYLQAIEYTLKNLVNDTI